MTDNIRPYKKRIWFLRQDEKVEEEKKARVANHVKICNEFWDEIANFLYILPNETAKLIIQEMRNYLNALLKK